MAVSDWNFQPITIDNFKSAADFLVGERVTEYGIAPVCLYAPIDGAEAAALPDGFLCRYTEEGQLYYTLFCDRDEKLAKSIYEELLMEGPLHLKYQSEERLNRLKSWFPDRTFTVETDETQSDYLYRREDFLRLEGRAARHKREHYQAFAERVNYTYREITAADREACLSVMNAWCSRKDCRDCEYSCERDLIAALFDRWEDYPCRGGLILSDGTPLGFFIGEKLGDTVIGYHQKNATTQLEGLTQAVYLETIRNTFPDVDYVNLGPDIGIEGLRRLKRQFKPFELLHKYTVTVS
jgi:hypothetical protein